MAKTKPSSAKQATPDISKLVSSALTALESDGVIKLSALGPASVREQVAFELTKQGYELTKSAVRKPVLEQLKRALADGAFIALKRVAAHTPGATTPEAKRAVLALVASGAAHLVLRGKEEVIVPINANVLSRKELLELNAFAKNVAKAAGAKNGLSLLQADVAEAFASSVPGAPTSFSAGAEKKLGPALSNLLAAVDATRDAQTGLSFVPSIVARLRPSLSPGGALDALLSAATSGLLELRPEGGINRLSAEELNLCPPGPQGTRLSWARRTESISR